MNWVSLLTLFTLSKREQAPRETTLWTSSHFWLYLLFLGENGRLEKRLEELGREKSEMMLKLEDEILRLNSSLADKEIEVLIERERNR